MPTDLRQNKFLYSKIKLHGNRIEKEHYNFYCY